jgi:hypothetical protein
MKKTPFLFCVAALVLSSCHVKKAERQHRTATSFSKAYGGTGSDFATCITPSNDGGYVMAASTNSPDGDVIGSGKRACTDIWIVKLDSNARMVWQKIVRSSSVNYASSIIRTPDNGYIIVGNTDIRDGDTSGTKGGKDAMIVKLDSSGSVAWQKMLGGSKDDEATSVTATLDGNFVMAGSTSSNDGDVLTGHKDGHTVAWIVKFNNKGRILWQKTLGTGEYDTTGTPASIAVTSDGGYMVAGNTYNRYEGVRSHGVYDIWLVKLKSKGSVVWQKILGGTSNDNAESLMTTGDGGYVLTGSTGSNDGEVSANHGYYDAWVVRLDSSGGIVWQKTLGGPNMDHGRYITRSGDSGYLVAGFTILPGTIDYDAWIVKLDEKGNMLWQEILGGANEDNATWIIEKPHGHYVMAGSTNSVDGNINGNHGGYDAWVAGIRHP